MVHTGFSAMRAPPNGFDDGVKFRVGGDSCSAFDCTKYHYKCLGKSFFRFQLHKARLAHDYFHSTLSFSQLYAWPALLKSDNRFDNFGRLINFLVDFVVCAKLMILLMTFVLVIKRTKRSSVHAACINVNEQSLGSLLCKNNVFAITVGFLVDYFFTCRIKFWDHF